MSSAPSNYTQQKMWLDRLKKDLDIFSSDSITMIKGYFSKTGLKTGMINILERIRDESIKDENYILDKKCTTIRTEFIKYIDQRILEMISPKETPWMDPWLLLSQSLEANGNNRALVETSLHIHDILFTANVVIHHELLQGKDLTVEELHGLKQILVDSYLKLLKLAAPQEGAQKLLDELQTNLPEKLVELETSLKEEDFKKAKTLLQQAEEEMRVSSEALRVLSKI